MDPLFEAFFEKVGLPNLMRKSDYHRLARHMRPDEIDAEVVEVLDQIRAVAEKASTTSLDS